MNPITERLVFNPIWLAPEAMKPNPSYNHLVDTYAFGVILWELIVRKKFFGELGWTSTVEDRVINGHRPTIPDETAPSEYIELIKRCWVSFMLFSSLLFSAVAEVFFF